MKYQEFFEKSKEIELYPFSAETKMLGSQSLTPSVVNNGLPIHGLYFPNETEIRNLWNLLATEEQRNDVELTSRIYDITLFSEGLFRTINLPTVATEIIQQLKAGVGNLSKTTEGKNSTFTSKQELTELLGHIYEKTGLLENDIRIKVINKSFSVNYKPNIIVDFKPAAVGYIGLSMIRGYSK